MTTRINMTRTERNYRDEACSDARDMLDHFADEIASQARDGDVSDDINNDYPDGDAYHHESHVDKSYSLLDAAHLLDDLRDDEETDSGLWQGLDPRDAVSAQAAHTYGNAVASRWRDEIADLNDTLSGEEGEDRREGLARLWLILTVRFHFDAPPKTERDALVRAALAALSRGDVSPAGILADWLDDHGEKSADVRAALALANAPAEDDEDDDEE